MYIEIDSASFQKLIKISNIKRKYLGDVAVEILEKGIQEIDLDELRAIYYPNFRPRTAEDGDSQ